METSGELPGVPCPIRLARRDYHAATRATTSCFISGDRQSRRVFPLAVMANVEQREEGVFWYGVSWAWPPLIADIGEAKRLGASMRDAGVVSLGGEPAMAAYRRTGIGRAC